jgi:hypothetical protein
MSNKRPYAGNARFIEIGSPGVPFRYLVNVDHLEGMRFEEMLDHEEVPVPGTGIGDIELETTTKVVSVGWSVVLLIQGKQNGINFPDMAPAIACYNSILDMLRIVGVPLCDCARLEAPKPKSPILGADGKAREAVRAAVLASAVEAGEEGEDLLDPVIDDDGELIPLTDEDIEAMEQKPAADPEVTKQ